MSKISKCRKPIQIFWMVALVVLVMQKVSGREPYLQLVGPSPLRFEIVAPEDPLFMAALALPMPAAETVADTIAPPVTSTIAQASMTRPASPTEISGGQDPMGIFGNPAKNAENFSNPASDLLNVSPQMITEYLKPNRKEAAPQQPAGFQPGQTILVPAELGFVPPMPASAESHAIYQSR